VPPCTLEYDPKVLVEDLPRMDHPTRERIRKAIKGRLVMDPEKFGFPLRRGLKGFRKLRIGDWRVIYLIRGSFVHIMLIGHRRDVYSLADKRLLG